MAEAAAATDRDLTSIQEARRLAQRAKRVAPLLAELTQEQIDRAVDAMAAAIRPRAEELARLAVEETGFGVVADKVQKNLFAADRVYEFIRPMKTVGVIARHDDRKVVEIAEPFGVVAAIVPSTNPTSTAIYKILIAIKARCPIVLSPHPSAARSITLVAETMAAAARDAGIPDGAINWMATVSLEGTQELMRHRDVAVILATGGMGLVRAAYSAGKPAYGVGPGNAPCFIERTADLAKAVADIMVGKTFDNGVLCSSPNSVVVDGAVADEVRREFSRQGGHFLTADEAAALAAALVTPQRLPNPEFVGKSAAFIAKKVGLTIPDLSYYVVSDWREGCERCIQILRYGGMGHSMSIHSRNEQVILEFGLKKPAFRILVNTPTTHGSIGLSTGLDPSMTLGCGGYGGNITSDNITPRHLLNIKRLAYETRPVASATASAAGGAARPTLPKAPAAPVKAGVEASAIRHQVATVVAARAGAPKPEAADPGQQDTSVVDFVCEEDVRQAIKAKRTILIGEKTIVTPAARDMAEAHRVFVRREWPR